MKNKQQTKGFTLVELMVTVAVMAIMAAIAWPNMRTFVAKTRVLNRTQQVANLLRYAKGEAVRMNVPIVVCGDTIRSDGRPTGRCVSDIFNSSSDNSKKSALKAFADKNRNGAYSSNDDIDIRTISLNGNAANPVVRISMQYCDIGGSNCGASTTPAQLVFMPNGKFGVQTSSSGSTTSTASSGGTTGSGSVAANTLTARLSSNTVIFTVSEVQNSGTPYQRHIKVDPSGQVALCSGSIDATANSTANLKCE